MNIKSATLGETARSAACRFAAILVLAFGPAVGLADGPDEPGPRPGEPTFPVTIRVNASRTSGEMRPVWRFFGHDEPNYTYMKDGQKLLSQLADLSPRPVYIRTHNLLTSGDGTPALKWGSTGVYSEDADGNPKYDWTILDRIFDTYRERGVKPYVQIGFMPEALSTQAGALSALLDAGRPELDLDRLGLSAQGLHEVGRAGPPVGAALPSSGTGGPRSRRGTGRSGTSRTSSTGGARPRSTTRSTTTPPTP